MKRICSDTLIDIDNNFKIEAGPGAGKTFWLVRHIKNVLKNSDKLITGSKIACITYTNNGVDEIKKDLGRQCEKVDVSTIHSFLYRNILKPYGFLLKNKKGETLVNLKNLSGHQRHIPNRKHLKKILDSYTKRKNNGRNYIFYRNKPEFIDYIKSFDWKMNADNEFEYKATKWIKYAPSFTKEEMLLYKSCYWKEGVVHHEDVLYLSYKILSENPAVIKYLNKKFPYIFVDEFQDTHPIQAMILKMVANKNTTIGVIGDSAQSIFEFQGADRKQFIEFKIDNMKHYNMLENRRCNGNIVELLNKLRKDFEQKKLQPDGHEIVFLVGDKLKAIDKIKSKKNKAILVRTNKQLNEITYNKTIKKNFWSEINRLDSCVKRVETLEHILSAIYYYFQKRFREARHKLNIIIKNNKQGKLLTGYYKKKIVINILGKLTKNFKEYRNMSLKNFNNNIIIGLQDQFNLKITQKLIRRGSKKRISFYKNVSVNDMYLNLRIRGENEIVRTIHNAKGSEFDTVLVIMDKNQKHYLKNFDLNKEEHRIFYVAFSRAKKKLFINIPSISKRGTKLLNKNNINILLV